MGQTSSQLVSTQARAQASESSDESSYESYFSPPSTPAKMAGQKHSRSPSSVEERPPAKARKTETTVRDAKKTKQPIGRSVPQHVRGLTILPEDGNQADQFKKRRDVAPVATMTVPAPPATDAEQKLSASNNEGPNGQLRSDLRRSTEKGTVTRFQQAPPQKKFIDGVVLNPTGRPGPMKRKRATPDGQGKLKKDRATEVYPKSSHSAASNIVVANAGPVLDESTRNVPAQPEVTRDAASVPSHKAVASNQLAQEEPFKIPKRTEKLMKKYLHQMESDVAFTSAFDKEPDQAKRDAMIDNYIIDHGIGYIFNLPAPTKQQHDQAAAPAAEQVREDNPAKAMGVKVSPVGKPGPRPKKSMRKSAPEQRAEESQHPPHAKAQQSAETQTANRKPANVPQPKFQDKPSQGAAVVEILTPPSSGENVQQASKPKAKSEPKPKSKPKETVKDKDAEHEEDYDARIREGYVDPTDQISQWLNSQDEALPAHELSPSFGSPKQTSKSKRLAAGVTTVPSTQTTKIDPKPAARPEPIPTLTQQAARPKPLGQAEQVVAPPQRSTKTKPASKPEPANEPRNTDADDSDEYRGTDADNSDEDRGSEDKKKPKPKAKRKKTQRSERNTQATDLQDKDNVRGTVTGAYTDEDKVLADSIFNSCSTAMDVPIYELQCQTIDWQNAGMLKDEMYEAFPFRQKASIRKFCQRRYQPFNRGAWSEEDDQRLRDKYEQYGPNWVNVGEGCERPPEACRDRWRAILQYEDTMERGPWSVAEEEQLKKVVKEYIDEKTAELTQEENDDMPDCESLIRWADIAGKMQGRRSARRCQDKWKQMKQRRQGTDPMLQKAGADDQPSKKMRAMDASYNKLGWGDVVDALMEIYDALSDNLDAVYDREGTLWSRVAVANQGSKFTGKLRRRCYLGALEKYGSTAWVQAKTGIGNKAKALADTLHGLRQRGEIEIDRNYSAKGERKGRDYYQHPEMYLMDMTAEEMQARHTARVTSTVYNAEPARRVVIDGDGEGDLAEIPETQETAEEVAVAGADGEGDEMDVDEIAVASPNTRKTPQLNKKEFMERCKTGKSGSGKQAARKGR